MNSQNLKIEKASIFDMNKIVRMAFIYHREDPKFQEILSNPVKSFFYRIFGPLYVRLKCESFKAVVSGKMVGYILLRHQVHGKSSIHIWDIVVHPDFRCKGVGTSLMKTAEKIAESKYRYLTLAVVENNTVALRLYQKLGYRNLQISATCFRIMEASTRKRSWSTIKLKPISGEEAISCRNTIRLDVVEAASGSDGREIAQSFYLSEKLKRGIDRFRIGVFNREAGYISVEHKKDLMSIFFLLHPNLWGTNTEVRIVETIIEYVSKLSKGQIEIWVMQAYEKSFERSLKKIGLLFDKVTPRLGLVKKLK